MNNGESALVAALRTALRSAAAPWAEAPIEPLPDSGLAHAHLRLAGTGVLARVPKQSQMDLAAQANLAYQAACFARAAASGHTPRLHGVLPPSQALPRSEIDAQAVHLDAAGLAARSLSAIERTREAFAASCAQAARPPRRLIAFDAHPGNFIIRRADGAAVQIVERVVEELDLLGSRARI